MHANELGHSSVFEKPIAHPPCETQKYDVLVVEDDPDVLDVVCIAMEVLGYRVTPALKGRIALEMLESRHFDLMITDLMMEDMDGIALLKQSKRICPATKVILMTGYYDPETLQEAVENEAEDYLLKPFSIKELRSKAASCLEIKSHN